MFFFGELRVVNQNYTKKSKLEAVVEWIRYLNPLEHKHIITMEKQGTFCSVRAIDFRSYLNTKIF